jgi:hypothetical protein
MFVIRERLYAHPVVFFGVGKVLLLLSTRIRYTCIYANLLSNATFILEFSRLPVDIRDYNFVCAHSKLLYE